VAKAILSLKPDSESLILECVVEELPTLLDLIFTNANSAATNNPFRATSTSAAKSRSPETAILSKNPP
jgi:hypothetical protein